MDIAAVRSLFPGTRGQVFLDAACVSLLPTPAAEALQQLTQVMLTCPAGDASAHHIALDRTAEQPRREAARLIGARPEEIALVESTTHGLQIVAAAVPLKPGDKILIGDTEFLGLPVPWLEREGVEVVTIPSRQGRLHVDDFARAADRKTRLILLSSVQWTSGYRADLEAFGDFARVRDLFLVVDAIQQLGAVTLDVSKTPVDFLVTGGHKWLNAPAGRGFLYVGPQRRGRLRPPPRGYLTVTEPAEGWAAYFATPDIPAVRSYDFIATAQACEIGGTANYPGNVVLGAALALINRLGIRAIEEHIGRLTDLLIDRLHAARVKLVSPLEKPARSGIVTFTLGHGSERDRACLDALRKRKILISQRYTAGVGGLRVSVHFFNNEDDVRQLADAVLECRG